MAAFTFYGTSLKGFRVALGPQQGLVVSADATSACVFVLLRASDFRCVLRALSSPLKSFAVLA